MTLSAGSVPDVPVDVWPLPPGIDTPAVVIDLDVVERNVERMVAGLAIHGIALRPHAKTHKSVRLARLQLEAGARGITVGTLGEAEVMAAARSGTCSSRIRSGHRGPRVVACGTCWRSRT